jgi:hypothetical protein
MTFALPRRFSRGKMIGYFFYSFVNCYYAVHHGGKCHFLALIYSRLSENCCNTMSKCDDFWIMIITAMHTKGPT